MKGHAHACSFPDDMSDEMRRQLLGDAADHAWFSVNIRCDIEGEYQRVAPFTQDAHDFACLSTGPFIDRHEALDKIKGRS